MPSLNISSTQRVIIDAACFSIICSLCLLIHLLVSPYKQGFWCNDKSIRYPYVKDSNVLSLFLVIFCFFLPIISIVIFESIEVNKSKQSNSNEFGWKSLAWKIYKNLIVFIMGSISLLLMTIAIKLISGRLKPYFVEICNPDVDCIFIKMNILMIIFVSMMMRQLPQTHECHLYLVILHFPVTQLLIL